MVVKGFVLSVMGQHMKNKIDGGLFWHSLYLRETDTLLYIEHFVYPLYYMYCVCIYLSKAVKPEYIPVLQWLLELVICMSA